MINRKFTPAEIAEVHATMQPEISYEIIDESMVWCKHFDEDHQVSGQLFIMENGQIIAHGVSAAEIYIAQDIYDGLSYLADIILTS